ncbi:head closure Hc2 [Vibrio phage D528]
MILYLVYEMATNKYFNNQKNTAQQQLAEQLIIQAIQHRGIDVKYIPAEHIEEDKIFNESLRTKFSNDIDIEVYVEDITNFNGSGDLYQAFGGFTMTDNATLVISQKRFKEEMVKANVSKEEPDDGDLIYIPYANLMFEVDKVLEDADFRQWGQNYVFRIRATKYSYGHEELSTGDPDIDQLMNLDLDIDVQDGVDTVVPKPSSHNSSNQESQDELKVTLDFGEK